MQTDLFIIPAAVQSFLASARFFEINLFTYLEKIIYIANYVQGQPYCIYGR